MDDDIRPNEIERMVELGTGVCRNASVVSVAWPLDVAVAAIERPCPARATGTTSTILPSEALVVQVFRH